VLAGACMRENIEYRPGILLTYMNVFVYQISKNAGLNVRSESTAKYRKKSWLNVGAFYHDFKVVASCRLKTMLRVST
jgi:hypothetical protein